MTLYTGFYDLVQGQINVEENALDAFEFRAFTSSDAVGETDPVGLVTNTSGDLTTLNGAGTFELNVSAYYKVEIWAASSATSTVSIYAGLRDSSAEAGGGGTAADIANVPAGNIIATTVQGAIDELDGDKAPLDSPVFPNGITVNDGESEVFVADVNYVKPVSRL